MEHFDYSLSKKCFFAAVVCFFVLSLSYNGLCETQKTETLPELIAEVLENNPGVLGAYSQWKAAEYRIGQSQSLPDPMLQYTYYGESVETRVGPQENKYSISQKIPFPAKLGMKGVVESKKAQMAREKFEAITREIIKRVQFVYYDIYWVDKAIQLIEEEKSTLKKMESVARKKYELNTASQQDVIKAQVELSKIINKIMFFQQNRTSLNAELNSLLNRDKNKEFGSVEEFVPEEFNYKLNELHEIAKETRQELLAARLDIERAEYEKSLAQMDYIPDLTFGFEYIQVGKGQTNQPNDGQDAWMSSFSINIPIWFNRLSDQLNEKKALIDASKKNYEDIENRVYYEVEDMFFKIMTYKDVVSLYKTALLPQTDQAFEATRTAYETDTVDFLNWLDSERVLLQTRLAYYKAIVDYQKSIAYLERVVGQDL
ncbi:MAG: TolC family protein [Candidatus Omnitrophica bacterium]|nr:TolC family protein [Candidatus Omnitrophota bacterium]